MTKCTTTKVNTVKSSETWIPIDGFEDSYRVSDLGRVRSMPRLVVRGNYRLTVKGRILKNSIDANGYATVNLHKNNIPKKSYVHRLVAAAFIANPLNNPYVAHWDGDGSNAKAENLRWVTQSENEKDKIRHGRNRYTKKGSRVFGNREIEQMIVMKKNGHSYRSIGRFFKKPHNTVKTAMQNGSVKDSEIIA